MAVPSRLPSVVAAIRPGVVAASTVPRTLSLPRRLHQSAPRRADDEAGAMPDALGDKKFKGRTGGGEPLDASSNPAPKPKITNASIPGGGRDKNLSKEQQQEVDQHNKEFDEKHDRGTQAPSDKVDKSFWSGQQVDKDG